MALKPKQTRNVPADYSLPERRRNAEVHAALLNWFHAHRRDLPWRRTTDPYAIWVSEIMLQQTRVKAVLEHYREFLTRFPTVAALAEARIDDVLAAWSGLGYYRRARALHAAAQRIAVEHGGTLPTSYDALLKLPGIGRYTAAAIASIAHAEPYAVVDGNVERVLQRLDGMARTSSDTWLRAQDLLDRANPGDWNQAMMELGAVVCTPAAPACSSCPVGQFCKAPGADTRVAQEKRRRAKLRYGVAIRGASARARKSAEACIYLVQRSVDQQLMPLMWELPAIREGVTGESLVEFRHSITNTDYFVEVIRVPSREVRGGRWVPFAEVSSLALTGITRKVLSRIGIVGVRHE